MTKKEFFLYELNQYDLNQSTKNIIKDAMREGLEIMSKKEITQCIEDHIELIEDQMKYGDY